MTAIEISTATVHNSIAQLLTAITPGAHVYDSPNQQKTELPAWFIVHREPTRIERKISRCELVYSIDAVYMLSFNLTQLYNEYSRVGDALDSALNYLRVGDASAGVLVHVFNRRWQPDPDGLKYSFELRFRVASDTVLTETMQVIEDLQAYLKDSGRAEPVETVKITFTNMLHPDFDVAIPLTAKVEKGTLYTLPTVGGKFPEGDVTYYPKRWTVGEFGESYLAEQDITTDLEWDEKAGVQYLEDLQYIGGDFQWDDLPTQLYGTTFDSIEFGEMSISGYNTQNHTVDMLKDGGLQSILELNEFMIIGA